MRRILKFIQAGLAAAVMHLCLCAAMAADAGATFEWQAPPQGDHWAEFRLWVPAGLARANAVISLMPGSNGDGRSMAADPEFQALAERTGSVLFAGFLKGTTGRGYENPKYWSGTIFLKALRELGQQAGHPEIADAPLAMWGHSAGGMFNYNFVCWKPERVAAFIVNKGANYDVPAEGAALEVPGLWFAGQKDEDYRLQGITNFFTAGRRQGAPWCLAFEPKAGHELGRTKEMGIFFLEAMMGLRLEPAAQTPPNQPAKLRPVAAHQWIGGLARHEVRPFDPRLDANRINSWLPDERTANRWRAFVTGEPFPADQAAPHP
ncbi:MAG: hypothetical protein PHQ12_00570 [Chthoniobacteraceae bacterium]|nr:hypothetical protein [Chthoniobacteraceae bacterium]